MSWALLSQTAESVTFEDLAGSLARIPDALSSIPGTLRNPAADPTRSMLVLGIVVIAVLIGVLGVVLSVMGPIYGPGASRRATGGGAGVPERGLPARRSRMSYLSRMALFVCIAALLWVSLGASSAARYTCLTCHDDNPHAGVDGDPHASVQCVRCHEDGGGLARVVIGPALRLEHVARTNLAGQSGDVYGAAISSASCTSCHEGALSGVSEDKTRLLRMSHAEPLEAGADCTDCHALDEGIVSAQTVGMDPCLRCHKGSPASASCTQCHLGEPARAVLAVKAKPGALQQSLVPNPGCDGCHAASTSCDSCHGLHMPHSQEFMAYGHARAGAIDIWENDGRGCGKCHYPGRRDCRDCHSGFPSHPRSFRYSHQQIPWGSSCGCHQWDPSVSGIQFCQICHPTKPASALSMP